MKVNQICKKFLDRKIIGVDPGAIPYPSFNTEIYNTRKNLIWELFMVKKNISGYELSLHREHKDKFMSNATEMIKDQIISKMKNMIEIKVQEPYNFEPDLTMTAEIYIGKLESQAW